LVAVALLDNQVMPEQYNPERIAEKNVQKLLKRVYIKPVKEFSDRFPAFMDSRITLTLRNGEKLIRHKFDYEGYATRPMKWETAAHKFRRLSNPFLSESRKEETIQAVNSLEDLSISEFMGYLSGDVEKIT
jgi:2-methylcitrate dehydratase